MRLQCLHCNQAIEIPIDQLEQTLDCPSCGRPFGVDGHGAQSRGVLGAISDLLPMAASMLIHTILVLLLALIHYQEPEPQVIVQLENLPTPAEEVVDTEPVSSVVSQVQIESLGAVESASFSETDIPQGEAGPVAPITTAEVTPEGISTVTEGINLSPPGRKGGSVSFFGIKSDGKYCCIIADCSGSMSVEMMQDLRRKISTTLDEMDEKKLCKLIFFESEIHAYAGAAWRNPKLDRSNIDSFVASQIGSGGTVPFPALKQVLTAKRRPDVIWLMSDGEFGTIADEVRQLNQAAPRTQINTISFNQAKRNAELINIAEQNNGRYEDYKP